MFEAAVIGGGIVGISAAYHLVRAGVPTVLFDRRDEGRATDAGAGILSPGVGIGHPFLELFPRAFDYYLTLVEELGASHGEQTGFATCARLVVAATGDEVEAFERALGRLASARGDDVQEISPREAQQLFPPLASVERALYDSRAGRMDGRLFERCARRAAEKLGLVVRERGVDRIVVESGRLRALEHAGDRLEVGKVVIAGGAWSKEFGGQLGVRIPVEPQRGQIIHLHAIEYDTADWPIVTAFHEHYMVPWPDRRVVVGATRETESGFDVGVTAAGIREVLDEALRVAPGLSPARVGEIRTGLRPLSADGMPVLGALPGAEGVYVATGHGANGLQLGPYSAKLVADLMLGRDTEDLTAFSIRRFDD